MRLLGNEAYFAKATLEHIGTMENVSLGEKETNEKFRREYFANWCASKTRLVGSIYDLKPHQLTFKSMPFDFPSALDTVIP